MCVEPVCPKYIFRVPISINTCSVCTVFWGLQPPASAVRGRLHVRNGMLGWSSVNVDYFEGYIDHLPFSDRQVVKGASMVRLLG